MNLSNELVLNILSIVDKGLVRGLGQPIPGQMCVEAAVNYAMGRPHGDDPGCVGGAVRACKIQLNDAYWPSDEARAAGMRKLAVAQIGSNTIHQGVFAELVILGVIQRIVPVILRKIKLEELAIECENVKSISDAMITLPKAKHAANEIYLNRDYFYLVSARVRDAIGCVINAIDFTVTDCYGCDTIAAKYAVACGTYSSTFISGTSGLISGDQYHVMLLTIADIVLEALKKLKSPGCEYLHLCDETVEILI